MLYPVIILFLVQALIGLLLLRRIRLIERLLADVSIDIRAYEQYKIQVHKTDQVQKYKKKITTVGNWKK